MTLTASGYQNLISKDFCHVFVLFLSVSKCNETLSGLIYIIKKLKKKGKFFLLWQNLHEMLCPLNI